MQGVEDEDSAAKDDEAFMYRDGIDWGVRESAVSRVNMSTCDEVEVHDIPADAGFFNTNLACTSTFSQVEILTRLNTDSQTPQSMPSRYMNIFSSLAVELSSCSTPYMLFPSS